MTDTTVTLVVAAELEDAFNQHEHLLPGNTVSRRLNDGGRHVVFTRTAQGAPSGAVTMLPVWSVTAPPERQVQLDRIEYYGADDQLIA
ncbi:hypothetical protein [Streptomyces sp. C3-3]|uniref:hypothetical protein n=1 Tax=Streptomyces sp. C3-3 TaxID=2824901 RepID=UPI001B37C7D1|nr:hypothetical protein [Streptomyces sp. C3-3]MBQ1118574.1 hypothetical protein [Streptomyces sp. C3-3]